MIRAQGHHSFYERDSHLALEPLLLTFSGKPNDFFVFILTPLFLIQNHKYTLTNLTIDKIDKMIYFYT